MREEPFFEEYQRHSVFGYLDYFGEIQEYTEGKKTLLQLISRCQREDLIVAIHEFNDESEAGIGTNITDTIEVKHVSDPDIRFLLSFGPINGGSFYKSPERYSTSLIRLAYTTQLEVGTMNRVGDGFRIVDSKEWQNVEDIEGMIFDGCIEEPQFWSCP